MVEESGLVEAPDEEDLGDANGATVERDRMVALADAARRGLEEIDGALARLDAGTYGTCEGCGEAIAPARLEALPAATHCVACKSGGLRRRTALGSRPGSLPAGLGGR